MSAAPYKSGLLLLVGLAAVLLLARSGAPWWCVALVVVAQVGLILGSSLDLLRGRFRLWALAILTLFLVSLMALPWLSVSTSPHEPDPVWRIPPPPEPSDDGAEEE